jgi:hypothetical protein
MWPTGCPQFHCGAKYSTALIPAKIAGPLAGKAFSFHETDPQEGAKGD